MQAQRHRGGSSHVTSDTLGHKGHSHSRDSSHVSSHAILLFSYNAAQLWYSIPEDQVHCIERLREGERTWEKEGKRERVLRVVVCICVWGGMTVEPLYKPDHVLMLQRNSSYFISHTVTAANRGRCVSLVFLRWWHRVMGRGGPLMALCSDGTQTPTMSSGLALLKAKGWIKWCLWAHFLFKGSSLPQTLPSIKQIHLNSLIIVYSHY